MISRETIRRGFPIKPLGEVAEFLDSRRRPITASERIPGPYPYYGANGQQDSVADYIFDEPLILLAEDGGPFDQPDRGIAYVIEGKTWVNNHAHVLRPRDHAQLRYLVRVLENYDVTPWITGSTRAKLTKAGAFKIQIPLPPFAEQKRIAGILDAADALRVKRREALAELDTLLQSTFLDMFGDPVTNPMGWEIPALSEVTDEIYRYPTYFGIVYQNEGVPEIRGELIGKDGKLDTDPSKLRFIAQATSDKFSRTQLTAGDLVMTVRGTIGKIGIVPAELSNANMTANLIRISPARSIIDPVFLLHVALGPYFLNQLSKASSSTTIKTIKALDLKVIPIPLPPLNRQHRFAAIVESVEEQKTRQRAHLAELDTLFASLQSRAFRGDL